MQGDNEGDSRHGGERSGLYDHGQDGHILLRQRGLARRGSRAIDDASDNKNGKDDIQANRKREIDRASGEIVASIEQSGVPGQLDQQDQVESCGRE